MDLFIKVTPISRFQGTAARFKGRRCLDTVQALDSCLKILVDDRATHRLVGAAVPAECYSGHGDAISRCQPTPHPTVV
jgi:hypothetical protein